MDFTEIMCRRLSAKSYKQISLFFRGIIKLIFYDHNNLHDDQLDFLQPNFYSISFHEFQFYRNENKERVLQFNRYSVERELG